MNFDYKLLLTALVVYLLAAYYSVGYYHADEHYQVIEFAGILDGSNEPKDLTWEYDAKIRPAIQPVIAFAVFQVCDSLSISSPYARAFGLRSLTALISVLVIFFFARSCKNLISATYWKVFLVLSYFLWFLPLINVRFSSETWSGLFLLIALGSALRVRNSTVGYLVIGSAMGLSFLFRFQIAFALLGLIAWLCFVKRATIVQLGFGLACFASVVFLGFLIDSWYYGEWTLTFVNNFRTNIINGKAAGFGSTPWYYYIFLIFRYTFFPIGTLILLSLVTATIKKPKSMIIWTMVPFVIGHSMVSHKELRFIFPLAGLLPILIVWTLEFFRGSSWSPITQRVLNTGFVLVFVINCVAMFTASFIPAGSGRVMITERIHEQSRTHRPIIIHSTNNNPYSPWGISTRFYAEPNAEFYDLDSVSTDGSNPFGQDANVFLVVTRSELNNENSQRMIQEQRMKKIGQSAPSYVLPLLKIYGYDLNKITELYQKNDGPLSN